MTAHSAETHLGPPRLPGRLLAEAVRHYEGDGASMLPEQPADVMARQAMIGRGRGRVGELETRIVGRAERLSIAPAMRRALDQVHLATAWMVLLLLLVAGLAGAGAARAALGGERSDPVNFFWVVTSLLGAQSVLLVIWLILILLRPRAMNVSPLGGAALALGRWLAGRVERGPHQLAAIRAVSGVYARASTGRWTLSAVSHALWAGFNLGCLGLLLVLLSAKHYTFTWETTILDGAAYQRITRWLGVLPEAVGFATPTPEEVTRSGPGATPPDLAATRRAWSGLLVGSIVAYGLAPRLLLLVVCEILRRVAGRRFRLDPTCPGYVRLADRLVPRAEREGVVDGDERPGRDEPAATGGEGVVAVAEGGPPAILGLEIEPPTSPWPPQLHAVRWTDLGFVDTRDDRRRVLAQLSALPQPPRVMVAVCGLAATPDRGVGAFLSELIEVGDGPVAILLTAGDVLRRRADAKQVALRVADWRRLAIEAGVSVSGVVEIDLDHLTDVSLAHLARLLGVEGGPTGGRRLERAFSLIADRAEAWSQPPDTRAQTELHKAIAELYRSETQRWRDRFGLPAGLGEAGKDLAGSVTRGAEGMVALLPERLKRSPKWLLAGATTGGLGCVAAAMLLSPAAIGAFPLWSAIGAAAAAALQPAGKRTAETPVAGQETADAVRAATLFALLLELQGREEAAISLTLERTLAGTEELPLDEGGRVRAWLDEVRHRFDLALAELAQGRDGGDGGGGGRS